LADRARAAGGGRGRRDPRRRALPVPFRARPVQGAEAAPRRAEPYQATYFKSARPSSLGFPRFGGRVGIALDKTMRPRSCPVWAAAATPSKGRSPRASSPRSRRNCLTATISPPRAGAARALPLDRGLVQQPTSSLHGRPQKPRPRQRDDEQRKTRRCQTAVAGLKPPFQSNDATPGANQIDKSFHSL
jgi:hypothetical protein